MTETLRQAMQRLFLAWGALCFRWRNALFPTVFVVLVPANMVAQDWGWPSQKNSLR